MLLASHETVMLMQKDQGVDPGTTHLLAAGCRTIASDDKVQLVSGAKGAKEQWKETHASSLDAPWRMCRRIFVEEMERRFKLKGHPGVHVLLCWKMNPSLDTSQQSQLFAFKSSVYELMEGEYMSKLRRS